MSRQLSRKDRRRRGLLFQTQNSPASTDPPQPHPPSWRGAERLAAPAKVLSCETPENTGFPAPCVCRCAWRSCTCPLLSLEGESACCGAADARHAPPPPSAAAICVGGAGEGDGWRAVSSSELNCPWQSAASFNAPGRVGYFSLTPSVRQLSQLSGIGGGEHASPPRLAFCVVADSGKRFERRVKPASSPPRFSSK